MRLLRYLLHRDQQPDGMCRAREEEDDTWWRCTSPAHLGTVHVWERITDSPPPASGGAAGDEGEPAPEFYPDMLRAVRAERDEARADFERERAAHQALRTALYTLKSDITAGTVVATTTVRSRLSRLLDPPAPDPKAAP